MTKGQILKDLNAIDSILNQKYNLKDTIHMINTTTTSFIVEVEKKVVVATHEFFVVSYDSSTKEIVYKPIPLTKDMAEMIDSIKWSKQQLANYIQRLEQSVIDEFVID